MFSDNAFAECQHRELGLFLVVLKIGLVGYAVDIRKVLAVVVHSLNIAAHKLTQGLYGHILGDLRQKICRPFYLPAAAGNVDNVPCVL